MAEATDAEPRAGLFSSNGEGLPLRSLTLEGDVRGYVVGLQAKMIYENNQNDPIEVLFRMPLEASQAVVGLSAVVDGRRIHAEMKEKEEAKAVYDDAIASGFTAAMGIERSKDVFSVSLGNLPGGSQAEVELLLAGHLPLDAEGKLRFSLPTALKDRYTPQQSNTLSQTASNVGTVSGTIHGIHQFLLRIHEAGNIASVMSDTHSIKVENIKGVMVVTLSEGETLRGDLVIQIASNSPHLPTVIVECGQPSKEDTNKTTTFMTNHIAMFNFFPKDLQTAESSLCEFIFLVDRSGSMSGGFIKSASETLVLFLKSLPENSYFNIYGFGSRYEHLFPSSVPYNQKNLEKATDHAQNLKADLGGTEILPPLQEIFQQPLIKGLTRQIFILTDGAVSNTSQCIDEVQRNAYKARCFTFGIGSGASSALVEGMAKAGKGTAEFIKGGERLQPKVVRSLKHAMQPAITGVSLTYDLPAGICVKQIPNSLPPIFDGDKFVTYGMFYNVQDQTTKTVEGIAKLHGFLGDQEISHLVSFKFESSSSQTNLLPVHHLAAKALIIEMEDEKKPKEDIVKLSIEASVISNETAFIAVDEDSCTPVKASLASYDIVSENIQSVKALMSANIDSVLTRCDKLEKLKELSGQLEGQSAMFYKASKKSSGGFFSNLGSAVSSLIGSFSSRSSRVEEPEQEFRSTSRDRRSHSPSPESTTSAKERTSSPGENRKSINVTPVNNNDPSSLIILQKANGSWILDDALAIVLDKSLVSIQDSCPPECDVNVWVTVLAVIAFRIWFPSQQDEWELIVKKAEGWLKTQKLPDELSTNDLYQIAEQFLS